MSNFSAILGKSSAMDTLIRSARIIAATDVTVLLKGETGTGKEVLAKAIQRESRRANKPFITLNCAAIPTHLVESEMFGYKKGAFTDATADKEGLLSYADGGTLFLDEINSLPLAIQPKLLRFIESGEFLSIGSTKPHRVNVRLIAASNIDLTGLIDRREFRQDLYFRLNVVPLDLPSLKERKEDIGLLAKHFFSYFSKTYKTSLSSFSKQSLKTLSSYNWPGNIRELRNLCERLSILLPGKHIEPENLPIEFSFSSKKITPDPVEFLLPETGIKLDELEAQMMTQALSRTHGNRSKAASLLGITRDAFSYRMIKHGLESVT